MIGLAIGLLLAAAPSAATLDCPSPAQARALTTRYANRILSEIPVTEARACATQLGWRFRVVRRNDCSLPPPLERRRDRVNATVIEGKVIYVYVG